MIEALAMANARATLHTRRDDTALLREGRVALMQPYFLPYLGYFQLIAASDCFVVYDNVQFIKNGWIERNRYLLDGEAKWFGLPLAKDSHSRMIMERQVSPHFDSASLINRLAFAYRKAPHVTRTLTWLEALLNLPAHNIAEFNELALRSCCSLFKLNTPIIRASEWAPSSLSRGQDRVIEVITSVGGTSYLNPAAGGSLYEAADFAEAGYALELLKPSLPGYRQHDKPFVPALSILDALMFNELETVSGWVRQGEILRA
ncbi:WbqC family protein [Pseudomonas abietaniphila]|jgi:hypothetical protein